MLEQLFGSKTRVLLLRLFLNNPEQSFFVRELTRNLNAHLNSIRRELNNLEKIGIIQSFTKQDLEKEVEKKLKDNKKYYKLNRNFIFVDELKSLLVKAEIILEQDFIKKIDKLGRVQYCVISGIFVGREDAPVDLLIVGQVKRQLLDKIIKDFEKGLNQQINYAVMSKSDYDYRKDVTDKFLYRLMEGKHMVVIDQLNKK